MYADIIIDISHERVDRPFQYLIPDRLLKQITVGVKVQVPFGKGNTLRTGYVVEIKEKPEFAPEKLKEIAGVREESVSVQSQLIRLAWWMRETYGSTMNQALKTVLPVKQKIKVREKHLYCCVLTKERLLEEIKQAAGKNYRARLRLLEAFAENPVIPEEVAKEQLQISDSTLRPLIERGIVEVKIKKKNAPSVSAGRSVRLNRDQMAAADRFREEYGAGIRKTYLLYGITGSGKTEVYMEMMDYVLSLGRQVILLIPEISLTYQTVMRFYRRFGDRIAVMNSRLSAGERYREWERAATGEVSVMIGPRSALFAPFSNLGLIIIDEEHEGAYKSETMPRYHAVEAARQRALLGNASLVLGSATPSLESFQRAESGEYTLLRLGSRAAAGSVLPAVEITDMRAEMREGNKSVFGRRLEALMEDRLARREQIMLFINRRGYSNFISCRSCGEAIRCPHCDVSLTLHGKNRLVCHYCGYTVPLMDRCPSCGSPYIAGFGAGTQKLEELTKSRFPAARILRMDADTTARKGMHEEILAAFAAHEADILIGTQMIVKGHDFADVTLVGIMAADLSLNTPDFRCAERTFQLLTQAAGRAGRGSRPGNVVIQTYQPEHYAVTAAAAQDYDEFYRQEIAFRRLMQYPPAYALSGILFSSPEEDVLDLCSQRAGRLIEELVQSEPGVRLIGPVQAPVYKVNDIYRKILYIKSKKCDILDKIRDKIDSLTDGDEKFRSVAVQYDIS